MDEDFSNKRKTKTSFEIANNHPTKPIWWNKMTTRSIQDEKKKSQRKGEECRRSWRREGAKNETTEEKKEGKRVV